MAGSVKNYRVVRVLVSKAIIIDYIEHVTGEACTEYLFKKYVERGLPARYEDKRWIAHADNIDEYFRIYTRVSMKSILNQIPDDI